MSDLTGRFAFRAGMFGAVVLECEVRKPHPWSDGPGSWVYVWRDATMAEVRDYLAGAFTQTRVSKWPTP